MRKIILKDLSDQIKFNLPIIKKGVLYLVMLGFVIILLIALFRVSFGVYDILIILDVYLRLLLSSWPGSILFLGLFVLWRHHGAIDHFIRNRMTNIGPDGIKAGITTSSASDADLKSKTIQEVVEVEEQTPSKKTDYKVLSETNIDKYDKISRIESILQASLVERYGERYKSQVKLSMEGKSIVVDGILYSKNGKKATAIEIKYVSSLTGYDTLRFIIARFKMKLAQFGIKRLYVIVVGDHLSEEIAIKIQEANLNLVRMFFYKNADGTLTEIPLPSRQEKLF